MKIYSVPSVIGGSCATTLYTVQPSGYVDAVIAGAIGGAISGAVSTTVNKPDIVVKGITGAIAVVDAAPGPAVPG